MYLKTCRCGKTKKNFKKDIGPFFMNDCCFEAGYDVHGNHPDDVEDAVEQVQEAKEMEADEITESMEQEIVDPREDLMKKTAKQLKKMADQAEIEGAKNMTKKEIVDALLGE